MIRAARFLHAYLRPASVRVAEEEVTFRVAGQEREATLYHPADGRPAPGWVVLHGLTVPGRRHEALLRFVRSLAASGATVFVPDVPSWRALQIDERAAEQTITAAIHHLAGRPEALPGGVGIAGFSFGATQALTAAADPSLRGELRSIVGFGGYCDLGRMVRSLFTGEHEWKGEVHHLRPDPYGRWIMVGNYLTRSPGFEGMEAVARAALALAVESGEVGAYAGDPVYDPSKARLRAALSPQEQRVWDVVAPPRDELPADRALAAELAEAFTAAALAADPGLDPRPYLPRLEARVVLAHGREDRLIPYTESLRLYELLPARTRPSVTITGLFAHSQHGTGSGVLHYAREGWRFLRLLDRAIGSL